MGEIRIYLDTCCYNRPFDIQDNDIISRETTSKLFIQSLVTFKSLQLVSSFILAEEIDKISSPYKKSNIWGYIKQYSATYVSNENRKLLEEIAAEVMLSGIKPYDAMHIACAVYAGCDYFISTD
jgi:predicted nucleic acid-binding protein